MKSVVGLIYLINMLIIFVVSLVVAEDPPTPSPSQLPLHDHHLLSSNIPNKDFKIPRIPRVPKVPKMTIFWVGYCTMECEMLCGKLRALTSIMCTSAVLLRVCLYNVVLIFLVP